jgi:predicted metal-dependent peptidase
MLIVNGQKGITTSDAEMSAIMNKVDRAKIQLMLERQTTFFSALLANLKLKITTDVSTAATNAIDLLINPDFIMDTPGDQLLGVLLHEVMHVALDHCNKLYKGHNQQVLGIAMDHYINLYITSLGYSIPSYGYCDPKYRGKSSMEIYHELMKNPPEPDPDFQPDVLGVPDQMSEEEYEQKVNNNIIKAVLQAELANDPGSIPGHIKQKVKELTAPELPWNLILLKYMDQYKKEDYSFSRPNKRYMPDFYLPHMKSDSLAGVTFALDVSGSMTRGELDEGVATCKQIKDMLAPEWVHFMTVDTQVHLDQVIEEYDELPDAELEGGGGTILEPVIDRIIEYSPEFAIIFTDGYFSAPANMKEVTSDIYWVIKNNRGFNAPHGVGDVIHLN